MIYKVEIPNIDASRVRLENIVFCNDKTEIWAKAGAGSRNYKVHVIRGHDGPRATCNCPGFTINRQNSKDNPMRPVKACIHMVAAWKELNSF